MRIGSAGWYDIHPDAPSRAEAERDLHDGATFTPSPETNAIVDAIFENIRKRDAERAALDTTPYDY